MDVGIKVLTIFQNPSKLKINKAATIRTIIPEIPKARIRFEYEIYNERNELLSKAETTLVFIGKENMKPRSAPEDFIEKLEGLKK